MVTPHVGVWIETYIINNKNTLCRVTPHVGVWIETAVLWSTEDAVKGHSPRGSVD